MQPVSIDEAYLDVTPGRYSTEHPVAVARRIRARVAELGVTCSVGVSASKSVAKIASDHDKPDGLTVVCPGEEAAFLAPLPVRAMPGIGPRTAERLGELGLRTLGDVAALDDTTARQVLGSHGTDLVARARGLDGREVHDNAGVKSVSNERTFATDVRTPAEVDGALSGLAAKVGQRLRHKGLAGRTVTVKLRFSDFTTKTVRRTVPIPIDDERVLLPIAADLLRSAWSAGIGLRLLGIGVSGFDDKAVQLDLLSAPADDDTAVCARARTRGARQRARRSASPVRGRCRLVRSRVRISTPPTRPSGRGSAWRPRVARLREAGAVLGSLPALLLGRSRTAERRPHRPARHAAAQPHALACRRRAPRTASRCRRRSPGRARSCSAACRRRGRRGA